MATLDQLKKGIILADQAGDYNAAMAIARMVNDGEYDDEATTLGLLSETALAVPRGFSKGVLSVGSGLAGLANTITDNIGLEDLIDRGEENEVIRLANQGKKAIDETMGVGDQYRDKWLVKAGEGLGSIGTFFLPGAALGVFGKGAALAGSVTAGAGFGASDQMDRIEATRAKGIDVSKEKEDASIVLGTAVGSLEAFVPLRILKRMRFTDDAVIGTVSKKKKLLENLGNAAVSGVVEGGQEALNSILQNAIQSKLVAYDPDVEVVNGESLWDDFTIGGAAGATLDLISNSFVKKQRSTITKEAELEREQQFREEEDIQAEKIFEIAEQKRIQLEKEEQEYELKRSAAWQQASTDTEREFLRQEQADAIEAQYPFDPLMAYKRRISFKGTNLTPSEKMAKEAEDYAEQIAQAANRSYQGFPEDGRFDVVEEPSAEGVQFKVVHSDTGKQYGQPSLERENAIHLMSNLNNQILRRNVNRTVTDSIDETDFQYSTDGVKSVYSIGQRLNNPNRDTVTVAMINEAGGTIGKGYNEERSLDSLHQSQYGVPPYTDKGKKIYKDLSNLTVAQQINLKRVQKGLPETNEFSLQEAKEALGDKYNNVFNLMLGVRIPDSEIGPYTEFGSVGAKAAARRNENEAQKEIEAVLESKNITSDINSPEMKYVFGKIVNETSIDNMTPSQKVYLAGELSALPALQNPAPIPDFTPNPYTFGQYKKALERVRETNDGTIENIQESFEEDQSEKRSVVSANAIRRKLIERGVINEDGSIVNPKLLTAPVVKDTGDNVVELKPYTETDIVTPEARRFEEKFKAGLKQRGLEDVGLRVLSTLRIAPQTKDGKLIYKKDSDTGLAPGVMGYYRRELKSIFLGVDRASALIKARGQEVTPESIEATLEEVLDHEMVHAVRNLDLWTKKEWQSLEKLAKTKIFPGTGNETFFDNAKRRYPNLGAEPVSQMEEAVAELIRYGRKDKSLIVGKPKSLVKKMFSLFEMMANAVRGSGFNTLDQVFESTLGKLESGEIGSRERGKIRTLRATERKQAAVPDRGIGREEDVIDLDSRRPENAEEVQESRIFSNLNLSARRDGLAKVFLEENGYVEYDPDLMLDDKPDFDHYVERGDGSVVAYNYQRTDSGGKARFSQKTFKNPTLGSLIKWMDGGGKKSVSRNDSVNLITRPEEGAVFVKQTPAETKFWREIESSPEETKELLDYIPQSSVIDGIFSMPPTKENSQRLLDYLFEIRSRTLGQGERMPPRMGAKDTYVNQFTKLEKNTEVETKDVGSPDTRVRPEVARAYKARQEGRITKEEYDAVVLGTISPYDFVPKPATYEKMEGALPSQKRDKINVPIEDGTEVGLRLDIPAYLYKGVWIPTLHPTPTGMTNSHRATARILNVDFTMSNKKGIGSDQKKGISIIESQIPGTNAYIEKKEIEKSIPIELEKLKETKKYKEADKKTKDKMRAKIRSPLNKFSKSPYAKMIGKFVNKTDEENNLSAKEFLNSPNWIQVGFDPRRHSYFYDRKTGEPVTFAEEVIQVGPLVLAKNATKNTLADGSEFETLYAIEEISPEEVSLYRDETLAIEEIADRNPVESPVHRYDETNAKVQDDLADQIENEKAEVFEFQTPNRRYGKLKWLTYQVADKFVGLKVVEDSINRIRRSRNLPPLKTLDSAYAGEQSISGKAGNELRTFEKEKKEPIADKIAKYNLTRDQVDDFLTLRHAIERNNRIALRDPSRDPESLPGAGKLRSGELLTNTFVKSKMEGLYGMRWNDATQTWSGGNARAEQLLDIAKDTDQIVNDTLDRSVKGELMNRDAAESVRSIFKYYTPLQGKNVEDEIANVIAGSVGVSGKSYSIKGKEVRGAMGKEGSSYSPLGTILTNAEKTISRSLNNTEFGKKLVNLINSSPDNEFWEVYSPENPRYKKNFSRRYRYIGSDPELSKQTFTKVPPGMSKKDFIESVEFVPDRETNDLIGVKINGVQHYVDIKGDDNLRTALIASDGNSANMIVRTFGKLNRFLSMVNTQLNPEFIIGNFSRDIQTAIYNIIGEQDMVGGKARNQKIVKAVLKDVMPSMGVFYKALRRYNPKDGTFRGDLTGIDSRDLANVKEFLESGAKADWFYTRPPEEQGQTIDNMIAMANGTFVGTAKRRWKNVLDFVEDANSAVENAVRLATFKASRDSLLDSGVKREEALAQAADLAKNLTINFNRKGMAGDVLNSLYLFFNASVQGTLNFGKGLFGPNMNPLSPEASRKKQGMVASLTLFSALLADKAEEESEINPETGRSFYSEIPNYIKERNLVVMADPSITDGVNLSNTYVGKDGKEFSGSQYYYMVPLPYGYNVFSYLGQSISDLSRDNLSVTEVASNLTSALMGSFSPIGISPVPTAFNPFVELGRNENFFGSPIYKDPTMFGGTGPASALSMSSTAAPFKFLAETANALGVPGVIKAGNKYEPGTLDVSPDTLEHLYEFAAGGAGQFVKRGLQFAGKVVDGEEIELKDTPFLRRVYGETDQRESQGDYFDRISILKNKENALKNLTGQDRLSYRNKNVDHIKMFNLYKLTEKKLKKLRTQRKKLNNAANANPEFAKNLADYESKYFEVEKSYYNMFNKKYDEIVGRSE